MFRWTFTKEAGYLSNKRVDRIEDQVENISHKLEKIDFQIQASLPPNE